MKWVLKSKNGIELLTIPEWEELGVQVVFTLRKGGISWEPYASLNLAFHVNDNPEHVLANRMTLLSALDCPADECVAGEQVHGNRVMLVTAKDKGRGIKDMETAFRSCDGLITRSHIGLMGFYADCVPLYFCCPDQGLVALAHAGWKGTVQSITREVMAEMKLFGCKPENCLAAIGPCIGSCCYEISENVAGAFREKFNDGPILERLSEGKYKLDLAAANQELMLAEGMKKNHIVRADYCTSCNTDQFFSYRREGLTGRMAAFIRKKEGV